jgi:tetratricopeptide (TPR) repeat protein
VTNFLPRANASTTGTRQRHFFYDGLAPVGAEMYSLTFMAALIKTRAWLQIGGVAGVIAAVLGLSAAGGVAWAQAGQAGAGTTATRAPASVQFQSLSKRAMAALDADKLGEAIPLFRRALALDPRWVEGWWSLGTAYYDQESYAEAELAFQHVVEIDPKHGTAHGLLGMCEFELGDDKAALKDIEASKELGTDIDPQLRNVVFYHEGVLLQRAGRFVAAEMPFASLCQGGAGSPDVVRGFGMTALRMRDRQFPPAGSEAATVAEMVGRGACAAAERDFDSARRELTLVISTYPHYPYVHYVFGRVLVDAQDLPGAVVEFKREIDEGHDRVLPMLQIAASEYKVDPAAGLPYAEQAVALAPKLPFAHYLYGLLLASTDQEEKAIPELEIARRAFPQDMRVYWSLATAYARVGRAQDAAKARAEVARLSKRPAEQGDGATPGASAGEALDSPIPVTDAADQAPQR